MSDRTIAHFSSVSHRPLDAATGESRKVASAAAAHRGGHNSGISGDSLGPSTSRGANLPRFIDR